MNAKERVLLENKLAYVIREKWGDSGLEYLVGAISCLTTDEQLKALIEENL